MPPKNEVRPSMLHGRSRRQHREEDGSVALSIQVEGSFGLTWPLWKQLATEVEKLGFAGLYRSDHFNAPPAHADALELVVSLTYLADHTERIHFGSLVAPLSFRDPVMLARQAAALDDLSGGRMILGIGAGWIEREHTMFGYDLGDVGMRMTRLGEGLEVITRLLRSEEPATYTGRFYQLRSAALRPRPQRPGGPPLLVGGTGRRRALPLVARYADIWNAAGVAPDEFRTLSAYLDELVREAGRQPGDVKRTLMVPVFCGRDKAELDQRMIELQRIFPYVAHSSPDALLNLARTQFRAMFRPIVGTPEQVVEQIRAYERAGVEELMVQCFVLDDLAGLRLLAEQVLPQLGVRGM